MFVVDNGPTEAPASPLVRTWLVRLARLLRLKSVTQKSFAEYHSKRTSTSTSTLFYTSDSENYNIDIKKKPRKEYICKNLR